MSAHDDMITKDYNCLRNPRRKTEYEIRKDRNALQESKVYIYSSLFNLSSAMVPAYALKDA